MFLLFIHPLANIIHVRNPRINSSFYHFRFPFHRSIHTGAHVIVVFIIITTTTITQRQFVNEIFTPSINSLFCCCRQRKRNKKGIIKQKTQKKTGIKLMQSSQHLERNNVNFHRIFHANRLTIYCCFIYYYRILIRTISLDAVTWKLCKTEAMIGTQFPIFCVHV